MGQKIATTSRQNNVTKIATKIKPMEATASGIFEQCVHPERF